MRENIGTGNETYVLVPVQDRDVVILAILEFPGHFFHVLLPIDKGFGHVHQILDKDLVVKFRLEYQGLDVIEEHQAEKAPLFVRHRVDVTRRPADTFHQIAQVCFGSDRQEIVFNQTFDAHQGKHHAILVVGKQFPFECQGFGVNGMGVEIPAHQVGGSRYDHQGNEEVVCTCDFGHEENGGQRGMHDTGHQGCHSGHGEIGNWKVEMEEHVQQLGNEQAKESAHEHGGREHPSHASGTVGQAGRHHLDQG